MKQQPYFDTRHRNASISEVCALLIFCIHTTILCVYGIVQSRYTNVCVALTQCERCFDNNRTEIYFFGERVCREPRKMECRSATRFCVCISMGKVEASADRNVQQLLCRCRHYSVVSVISVIEIHIDVALVVVRIVPFGTHRHLHTKRH